MSGIDLDPILETALRGVRRTAVFLGLGVSAATQDSFTSYQLTGDVNIRLVPDNVSPEEVAHFKSEFRRWVEANGFRELTETFGTFLDQIHEACLRVRQAVGQSSVDLEEAVRSYASEGVPNKLNMLNQKFGIKRPHEQPLISLNRARNCLVHRQGLVDEQDAQGGSALNVGWRGIDVFAEAPGRPRVLINEIPAPGVELPADGRIVVEIVDRTRLFPLGSRVAFSTRELAEICWFYVAESTALRDEVISYAGRVGVPFVPKSGA